MCQPWNLELHPEQFPRAIHVRRNGGRFPWADQPEDERTTIEGRWISDQEFEAIDGRIFVCPAPNADGVRQGEVVLKAD